MAYLLVQTIDPNFSTHFTFPDEMNLHIIGVYSSLELCEQAKEEYKREEPENWGDIDVEWLSREFRSPKMTIINAETAINATEITVKGDILMICNVVFDCVPEEIYIVSASEESNDGDVTFFEVFLTKEEGLTYIHDNFNSAEVVEIDEIWSFEGEELDFEEDDEYTSSYYDEIRLSKYVVKSQ